MSTRAELARGEMSPEQARTNVAKHPDYFTIEALFRRGRPPRWISNWVTEHYPLQDKEGNPHEDATANEAMQLSTASLTRYRDKYLPECSDGPVSGVINEELEALIGYRLPAPVGMPWELEVLETVGIQAAQVNLARAMKSDAEMEMLNPATLDAHSRLVDVLGKSIEWKSRLGTAGYEAAPEKQHIVTQNENYNVNVSGAIDPNTGAHTSVEPEKLDLARDLLKATPEEREQIVAAVKAAAATPAPAEIELSADDVFEVPNE